MTHFNRKLINGANIGTRLKKIVLNKLGNTTIFKHMFGLEFP